MKKIIISLMGVAASFILGSTAFAIYIGYGPFYPEKTEPLTIWQKIFSITFLPVWFGVAVIIIVLIGLAVLFKKDKKNVKKNN